MKSFRLLRSVSALATTAAALLLLPSAVSAQTSPLAMRVPSVADAAIDAGVLAPGTQVRATLYLQPSATRRAALDSLLAQQLDPTSGSYRQWLTPAQFAEQFGPDAAQLAAAHTFLQQQGIADTVSPGGVAIEMSGTAAQMEAAFAPGLHAFTTRSGSSYANTAVPLVPTALAPLVMDIVGFDTVSTPNAQWATDVSATAPADLVTSLHLVVSSNRARVLGLTTGSCAENMAPASAAAVSLLTKEAAAQGITVVASGGCSDGGTVSYPATLAEVLGMAIAPGAAVAQNTTSALQRPAWQVALGLPADGLRHAPDITATSVGAVTAALTQMLAQWPASSDGSPAREGNLNALLYERAATPGLFTQPDGAAAGSWESLTGLGQVNPAVLARILAGTNSTNVSVSSSNYSPTHGQTFTLSSSVTDTSGKTSGAVATGTVTFTDANGNVLGSGAATLVNGTATAQVNNAPGGSLTVTAKYSGDSSYAAASSNPITFTIQPEAATFTANVSGSTPVGGNIPVVVTLSSASGIGTPSGTVSAQLQGVSGAATQTATLSGSNGTVTATLLVPALKAGSVTINVTCTSTNPSFTCYPTLTPTATVTMGTTSTSLQVNPYPVGTGTETLTATVTGAASPAAVPTGNVAFYDNGTFLANATLNAGVATYSGTLPTATSHALTAQYGGDSNYAASVSNGVNGSTGTVATTTTLKLNPQTPVAGTATTLTATVANAGAGATPTGTVTFYEDGAVLGTGALSGSVATYSSTAISGTAAHTFYAVYGGDTVNAGSQSSTVTSTAATGGIATSTSLSLATTAPAQNTATTLTATVTVTGTAASTAPTGTVNFYSSVQALLGSATLSGSTATANVTFTTAGAQSVYATYVGDTNYAASTSTTTAVTVSSASTTTATQTLVVSPASPVSYASPVVVTAVLAGATLTSGSAPAGTETLSVTPAGSVAASTATLVSTSATGATATFSFTAPSPGTYTLTATCTGTNFTCPAASTTLVVAKGATTTTVIATPSAPTAGQAVLLTATLAPVAPSTGSNFTGTVTFYDNAVSLGMATVTGATATFSTTLSSTTNNVITAVYSGDTNWSASTSSALNLVAATTATTGSLSVNRTTALYNSNLIFTATIGAVTSSTTTTSVTPSGTVSFYDTFNGQTVALGNGTLVAAGVSSAIAQLSTTGLLPGTHSVTAVFASSTTFTGITTNAVTVNITDYSLSFNPSSLTLKQGASGMTTLVVTAVNGFAGTVVLGCTPPGGTATTCSFSPTTLTGSGTSTLTIGTTAPVAELKPFGPQGFTGIGTSLAALLGCLLVPRRRRPALLAVAALLGVTAMVGCTNLRDTSGTSSPVTANSGTPLGTQTFTITTSGTDGQTTVQHNVQFSVTVQ